MLTRVLLPEHVTRGLHTDAVMGGTQIGKFHEYIFGRNQVENTHCTR